MSGGSAQLRRYRRLRRDGASQIEAAMRAGISLGEANLVDADDARCPPSPEAFELLEISRDDTRSAQVGDGARPEEPPREAARTPEAGTDHRQDEPDPGRARPANDQPRRSVTMGRARKQKTEEVEELGQKDFGVSAVSANGTDLRL
ncbi:hypothetical protein GVO57_11015 [Sphingomonas changnyeongensis]|uniref:Uncharacterized protein n=1 Tax=Sphingomonas changnyeongensis TaxID=2698679 RepID=A0A7Z2S9X4_9SPHN|nr:hypothetical protein [Sphingomonas changnyeongensis]QHL91244.1 hypothetical protein GVO57_11015 [Sphingomonas changnyeongensis]